MGKKKSKKTQPKPVPPTDESLLGEFCLARINNYNLPKRTKREKGTTAAVGVAKYVVSVYVLIGWPNPRQALRQLAENTETNYTMLRRWTREKEFNDLVVSHVRAFTVVFFDYLKKWHGRHAEVFDAAKKQPLSSINFKDSEGDRDALLREFKTKLLFQYSPRLSIILATLLLETIKATEDVGWMNTLITAQRIISAPIIGYQVKEFQTLRRDSACCILDLSKKEITKPTISLNDKKSLLLSLDMVSDDIREGLL